MQTFRSHYGRKGVRVSDTCPTYAIRRRLRRVNVGASDEAVTDMIREAVEAQRAQGNADWTDAAEREAIRFALWEHAENREEYRYVMGGLGA